MQYESRFLFLHHFYLKFAVTVRANMQIMQQNYCCTYVFPQNLLFLVSFVLERLMLICFVNKYPCRHGIPGYIK